MAALGAATRWAIERFAVPEAEQEKVELAPPMPEAHDWKFSPSVGTWLMQRPMLLASPVSAVAPVAPVVPVAVAKIDTPSKVKHVTGSTARSPAKVASPKVKSNDQAGRDLATSPKIPRAAANVQAETSKSEVATANKQRGISMVVPQKRETSSAAPESPAVQAIPKEKPQTPECNSKAVKETKPAAPGPKVAGVVSKKTLAKSASSTTPSSEPAPATAPAPESKAPRAKSPAAPRAKSPPAPRAKSPAKIAPGRPVPRAAATVPAVAKPLSSAEIEVQKIEEKRKQAKLVSERNARRMIRTASSKTSLQASGKDNSLATPAPSASTPSEQTNSSAPKTSPRPEARRPSPVRKTCSEATKASDKASGGAAAKAKAVVAAVPTPARKVASAQPQKPGARTESVRAQRPASPKAMTDSSTPAQESVTAAAKGKPSAPGSRAAVSPSSRSVTASAPSGKLARKPSPARGAQKAVPTTARAATAMDKVETQVSTKATTA